MRKLNINVPKIAEIEITNECNLNCVFCPREKLFNIGAMDYLLCQKIISRLSSDKYEGIYLCGLGEPLLHGHLMEIIKYAKRKGLRVGISTNGLLMDSKIREQFIDSRVDRVDINFPSLKREIYEKMCLGSRFNQVKRNIDSLLDAKSNIQVRINIVVTNLNLKEESKIIQYWSRRKALVNLVPFADRGKPANHFSSLRPKSSVNKRIFDYFCSANPVFCCSFLFDNYTFIGWDGYEYACPVDLNKRFKEKFFLSPLDALRYKEKRKLRFWKTKLCRDCRKMAA